MKRNFIESKASSTNQFSTSTENTLAKRLASSNENDNIVALTTIPFFFQTQPVSEASSALSNFLSSILEYFRRSQLKCRADHTLLCESYSALLDIFAFAHENQVPICVNFSSFFDSVSTLLEDGSAESGSFEQFLESTFGFFSALFEDHWKHMSILSSFISHSTLPRDIFNCLTTNDSTSLFTFCFYFALISPILHRDQPPVPIPENSKFSPILSSVSEFSSHLPSILSKHKVEKNAIDSFLRVLHLLTELLCSFSLPIKDIQSSVLKTTTSLFLMTGIRDSKEPENEDVDDSSSNTYSEDSDWDDENFNVKLDHIEGVQASIGPNTASKNTDCFLYKVSNEESVTLFLNSIFKTFPFTGSDPPQVMDSYLDLLDLVISSFPLETIQVVFEESSRSNILRSQDFFAFFSSYAEFREEWAVRLIKFLKFVSEDSPLLDLLENCYSLLVSSSSRHINNSLEEFRTEFHICRLSPPSPTAISRLSSFLLAFLSRRMETKPFSYFSDSVFDRKRILQIPIEISIEESLHSLDILFEILGSDCIKSYVSKSFIYETACPVLLSFSSYLKATLTEHIPVSISKRLSNQVKIDMINLERFVKYLANEFS